MRPKRPETMEGGDLFRARLDQIINPKHELVQLGAKIDWDWINREIAPLYSDKGRPRIQSRFVIGLLLLKHIYGLSNKGVCERWVYDPYFQHFTGFEFFSMSFHTSVPTSVIGASGSATSWSVCWPRAKGGARDRRAADTRSRRATVDTPVSPRPSPSRPTPSSSMRRSGGSIGWPASMACGCGSHICASPSWRR